MPQQKDDTAEWCPVARTAKIISKKWHPIIVYYLIDEGGKGFNELKEKVNGISSKVLSESLDDLEQKEIVNRNIISEKPFRVKYEITEKGKDLEKIIRGMETWGDKHKDQ